VNIFRRIKDWAVGPGGWLADSDRDANYARIDWELDHPEFIRQDSGRFDEETLDDDVAWINEAATQDPNDGPGRIRIIHQGKLGYRYWYTNHEGLITSQSGFRTEGKAWRAALTKQNNETAIDDDYPN
jgi:hypothetical protein